MYQRFLRILIVIILVILGLISISTFKNQLTNQKQKPEGNYIVDIDTGVR